MGRSDSAGSCDGMFIGSVTVGDRGQVVIPADVRKELAIKAGDRLLCFRSPLGPGVVIVKIDSVEDVLRFFQTAVATLQSEGSRETSRKGKTSR